MKEHRGHGSGEARAGDCRLVKPLPRSQTARLLDGVFQQGIKGISESLVQRLRSDQIRGSTLGKDRQHWRRARFFQQCRLFFPFHVPSKKVVLAWVNDSSTRRAYRSRTDAYRVFQDILDKGQPPDDWDQLLGEREVKACWPMILANSYAPWLSRLSRCSWR